MKCKKCGQDMFVLLLNYKPGHYHLWQCTNVMCRNRYSQTPDIYNVEDMD